MAYFLNLYENITRLNPLYGLYFVSLFFKAEIHYFLHVLWCHQLKRAIAATGENSATDCKTVLFMFQVPLGMSCFKNYINCGNSNSGKCFSKGLVLGDNRFV